MALLFLRLAIYVGVLSVLLTQIFLPLWRGDPIFPWFNKDPNKVRDAEKSVLEAEANLRAARLTKKAEGLNSEAWAIEDELYLDIENDGTKGK